MVRIRWYDGALMKARSWSAMLELVNELPWNADLTEEELREALAKRAHVWSLRDVDPNASARDLFHELEKAKLLTIVRGTK
jgi:hypothetical protein